MSEIIMGQRRRLLCASAAVVAALPVPALAQTQTFQFNIEAQSLDGALRAFARTTRRPVLFDGKLVKGKTSQGLQGTHTAENGLAILLSASRLRASLGSRGAYVIKAQQPAANGDAAALQAVAAGGSAEEQAAADAAADPIVVTGSRIDRAGFDAPTPTTVIGQRDLAQGARTNVSDALNDLPAFRPTQALVANSVYTSSGSSQLDLRGLGITRTLTLLNGRRFTGYQDLNNIPMNLVKRIDVVTGGASAAWGSGAVAGVVNIILDDELDGLTIGAQTGVSSRGDGARYGLDASFGTRFADDRGHFMIGVNWLDYRGIPDRFSRKNMGSGGTFINPNYTPTNGEHAVLLLPEVYASNAGKSGLILSGILAGQTFNSDGSLRPFQFGNPRNATTMVGGEGWNTFAGGNVTQNFQRKGVFARANFDVTDAAKLWVEANFTRMTALDDFFPDSDRAITIRSDNAYLSTAARSQLLAAGQASFTMGRWFQDKKFKFDFKRENFEGAIGVDGTFGKNWRYSGYYAHGELYNDTQIINLRIRTNYLNAVDAIISPTTGQPICRIALTTPTTNCVPVNLFGEGNISDQAAAYIFGTSRRKWRTKLDTTGVSLRGDPFSLWAGPLSIAIGAEARWESSDGEVDPISAASGFVNNNLTQPIGKFNVKEGFGEIVVPLIDIPEINRLEFNAAARYSHYSNTGGIWSWKVGATNRSFNDLLLRGTYSRDIRSGSILELFTARAASVLSVVDPVKSATVTITNTIGGNPKLNAEKATTLTLGGSYTPHFAPGLSLSIDYYKIEIDDVIATLSAQNIVTRCANGNTALCAQITRDATGTLVSTIGTFINLSKYETSGIDVEASYVIPAQKIAGGLGGHLRLRALATYVDSLVTDDGITRIQSAGIVGDNTNFGTPKWRATGSIAYEGAKAGADLRVRYVGGGVYSRTLDIANNSVSRRTYVDLGLRYDAGPATLSANVVNLFDKSHPYPVTQVPFHYDVIGRYFSAGVKVKF